MRSPAASAAPPPPKRSFANFESCRLHSSHTRASRDRLLGVRGVRFAGTPAQCFSRDSTRDQARADARIAAGRSKTTKALARARGLERVSAVSAFGARAAGASSLRSPSPDARGLRTRLHRERAAEDPAARASASAETHATTSTSRSASSREISQRRRTPRAPRRTYFLPSPTRFVLVFSVRTENTTRTRGRPRSVATSSRRPSPPRAPPRRSRPPNAALLERRRGSPRPRRRDGFASTTRRAAASASRCFKTAACSASDAVARSCV